MLFIPHFLIQVFPQTILQCLAIFLAIRVLHLYCKLENLPESVCVIFIPQHFGYFILVLI